VRTQDITPREARRDFLKSKRQSIKESAARTYEYPTKHFVQFLERNDIEEMGEVNGYTIQRWKFERQEEDIAPVTFHVNVKHIAVFIRWCESMELVDEGLADKIEIPKVTEKEAISQEQLEAERAEELLRYLSRYEYAKTLHALLAFLWHTGCRISGAIAIDLEDYKPAYNHVKFRNRPKEGTPLKNAHKSERNVTLSSEVIEVVSDYINARRTEITDDHGREPLFTTPNQRLHRNWAYKNMTALTRPCKPSGGCPHNRVIEECEAAQRKKSASKCPSSRSLHPIRRSSITYHLNTGWPVEKVSARCDVSVEVLEKHYDARTHEDKRDGRTEHVDEL
jgi:site-specific recombinase XerD